MRIGAESFRGEVPRLSPRLLPDNAAQSAVNARLLSGDLEAWRQFLLTKVLANASPVESIYLLNDKWLSWSADVDAARGAIPGDNTFRLYLTGPDVYSEPRFTNYALATTGAEPYPVTTRPLGVPGPDSAPTLELGVDPTPTTFSVNVLDEGDELVTSWATSPPINAGGVRSQVVQNAVTGNPAPSYEFVYENNDGDAAWAYRNFGIQSVTVVDASVDFMFTSGDGSLKQMLFHVMNSIEGNGITAGYASDSGELAILLSAGWISRSSSRLASVPVGGIAFNTWYRVRVVVNINTDGTQTVTASLRLGSVELASVTTTNNFILGGYCGFVAETANSDSSDEFRTFYDNIRILGSGSAGYVPANIATSYVYTFVNDLGEESAPSPTSATVVRPDGVSVTITTPTSVPSGVSSDYGIATKRIYRAATGNTGTVFRFVAEIPLGQDEYVDVLTDAQLGEVLESEDWDLPPDDLRGILALPNGIMVGFRRNQLCFSAQNHPHAWPISFRLNTDTDIVAIGNIDTTVVIGTESFPYLAIGSDPAAYSMTKLEVPQACVSKRSLAYLTNIGVAFASPDGMIAVAGSGQVRNLTEKVFTRKQWQALNPETILGIAHDDVYHFWYESGATGVSDKGYMLDMKADGFGVVELSYHAVARYADPVTDNLYLVLDAYEDPHPLSGAFTPDTDGLTIYQFDADEDELLPYLWKGKLNLLPNPTTFNIAQVRAADYDDLQVTLFADGTQFFQDLVESQLEFVLPMPDEYVKAEAQFAGTSRVYAFQIAEDVSELT